MYRFGLALTLLMLTSCSTEPAQADGLAVPGRSVGAITLGMPRAEVWKHLGKPTEIHFLHLAGRSYTWDGWDNNHQREFVTLYRGQVVQIERDVTYTEAQISHGDWHRGTFSVIRRQHPHLKAALYSLREEVGMVALIDDRRQGVAWSKSLLHFEGDHKMDVFSEICPEKVIVHQPGYAVLPDVGEDLDKHNPLLSDFRVWCLAKPTQKGN